MFPLELVIAIADQIETGRHYFNLARTCKAHYRTLVDRPWKDIHIHFHPTCWRECGSQPAIRGRVIRDGAVQISSKWQMTRIHHSQCPMSPCEACEIEVALLPLNAYLNCQARNVCKDLRELKLSGWLPQTLESVNEGTPGHTFKGPLGVCALRPEILNIEVRWPSWSPIMLSSFDLTRLRSLKMPVRAPLDCRKIGAAFLGMPHLEYLTITALSDSQDFVDEFRHLGDGIMALSSALRSLDVTITNCNRAEDWEKDEAFVEPDDVAFFFQKFFPEPSCHQIEALVRARYEDPRESLDVNILQSSKGQLNLERLRLEHIGLPWWAFQTVFNPETIKELDLPTCRTAPNVWVDLGKHAQLYKLAHINYDVLSGPFRSFLSTQHSLRSLSFARPPDIYILAGAQPNLLDTGTDITDFAVKEAAPHLGPGTEWGRTRTRNVSLCQYPSNSDFVRLLSNKTSLRHLVLPADMFDITRKFITFLATKMPALESIELAFDYACPELREFFIKVFIPSHPHLKKITFLSLNRPHPLSDFDAKVMHAAFTCTPCDIAPASLKYVRYRDLNDKSHKGEFNESDVYYHRQSIVIGNWWQIPAREGERMFEDGRTPDL